MSGRSQTRPKHKTFKIMTKNNKLSLRKNDGSTKMKPYCETAKQAAEIRTRLDALKPEATAWLQKKLNSDPETRDFKGTVICVYDDQLYKICVKRPEARDFNSIDPDDPLMMERSDLQKEIENDKNRIDQIEDELAENHPECVSYGFTISFLKS